MEGQDVTSDIHVPADALSRLLAALGSAGLKHQSPI